MIRLLMCLIMVGSLGACSLAYTILASRVTPPRRNYAERFVDAETNKPIEGVYAQVIWRIDEKCVRSAWLRSGPDGWIRQSAPRNRKAYLASNGSFAPGYRRFSYDWIWNEDRTKQDYFILINALEIAGANEAFWVKSLESQGYVRTGSFFRKPINRVLPSNRDWLFQLELIKYDNLPIGKSDINPAMEVACRPGEGEVIGFELVAQVHEKQARESARILCELRQDFSDSFYPGRVRTAISLLDIKDETNARAILRREIPTYPSDQIYRMFNPQEREQFCALVKDLP